MFWLNRDLGVYLVLYVPDFPKSTYKYFLYPSTFKSETPVVKAFFVKNKKTKKKHQNYEQPILAKKIENLGKNTLKIGVGKSLNN